MYGAGSDILNTNHMFPNPGAPFTYPNLLQLLECAWAWMTTSKRNVGSLWIPLCELENVGKNLQCMKPKFSKMLSRHISLCHYVQCWSGQTLHSSFNELFLSHSHNEHCTFEMDEGSTMNHTAAYRITHSLIYTNMIWVDPAIDGGVIDALRGNYSLT